MVIMYKYTMSQVTFLHWRVTELGSERYLRGLLTPCVVEESPRMAPSRGPFSGTKEESLTPGVTLVSRWAQKRKVTMWNRQKNERPSGLRQKSRVKIEFIKLDFRKRSVDWQGCHKREDRKGRRKKWQQKIEELRRALKKWFVGTEWSPGGEEWRRFHEGVENGIADELSRREYKMKKEIRSSRFTAARQAIERRLPGLHEKWPWRREQYRKARDRIKGASVGMDSLFLWVADRLGAWQKLLVVPKEVLMQLWAKEKARRREVAREQADV